MAQEAQCIPEMLSEQLASGDLAMIHIHTAVKNIAACGSNCNYNCNGGVERQGFFDFEIGNNKFFQTIGGVGAGKSKFYRFADRNRHRFGGIATGNGNFDIGRHGRLLVVFSQKEPVNKTN